MPEGHKHCSDEEIGELFEVYARLLGHLDAFFSIICKKRFHLNDSDVDKAMPHLDAIDNLRRYPKMSVAPKLHILSALTVCPSIFNSLVLPLPLQILSASPLARLLLFRLPI